MSCHRRIPLGRAVGCLALLAAVEFTVPAATWHVEKDDSGDFSVIQDAVDASAAGDTIRIGPGRFTDWRLYPTPDGQRYKIVHTPHNLTFIGAGQDQTVLGPDQLMYVFNGFPTNGFNNRGLDADVRVENLRIENLMDAFDFSDSLRLRRVSTHNMRRGIVQLTLADFLDIEDCEFVQPIGDIIGATINHSFDGRIVDVAIRDTRFVGGMGAVNIPNARLTLEDCTFQDTFGPLCWAAGEATIRRCVFTGAELGSGIWIDNSVVATITDCWVGPTKSWNLRAGLGAQVVGERNHFSGSRGIQTDNTIDLGGSGTSLVLRNCDILRQPGTKWSVFNGSTTNDIDLRWNYWGTTEPDSFSTWIRDRNDCTGDACRTTYVLYEPFLETPVPVKARGFGALKALFGWR